MASRSRRDRKSRKSKLFIGISTVAFVAGLAATAWSVEAIRNVVFLPGTFGTVAKSPDASSGPVNLGFSAAVYGPAPYNTVYVNENGNVTFTAPNPNPNGASYDPGTDGPMIAPFFTDIDTTQPGSGQVEFGQAIVDGRQSFVVNWPTVSLGSGGTGSFQLVLSNLPDGSLGVEFNYGGFTPGASGSSSPLVGIFPGTTEDEDGDPAPEPIIFNPDSPDEFFDPTVNCDETPDALVCVQDETQPDRITGEVPNGDGKGPNEIAKGGPLPEGNLPPTEEQGQPGGPEQNPPLLLVDDVVDAPEPATIALFGLGLAGLGALRRRRRAA